MTIDPFEYEKYKKYFFANYITVISDQDLLFSDEKYNKYRVHHYTNINGLDGILKEGEFWVSQADFLNDKTEMKYTFDMSKEIFSSICKEKKKSQDDGYSITFKFKELFDGLTQDRNSGDPLPIASKVIYEKSEQKSKLLKLLSEIIDRFEDKTNKGNYDVNSDGFIINAITVLEWYSIFFKDECFSQEEEFRIAFLYLRNRDAKIYDCRISNGTFIPYVKIKIDCNSVKGVTIGPKNNMDINKEGLRKFPWKHEYDLTKVNISKSKIPYRY
ncbi:DUF2971 domain-containing protein [Bacillus altitudinis]|uniref:DUF2971 domain-containing protein n=1 Tax=Bacillus altitudinis TaxID=293387 RepID=UPI0016436B4C|nr:DUF2971 domain-containing protein [Bacillus altitudinis]